MKVSRAKAVFRIVNCNLKKKKKHECKNFYTFRDTKKMQMPKAIPLWRKAVMYGRLVKLQELIRDANVQDIQVQGSEGKNS